MCTVLCNELYSQFINEHQNMKYYSIHKSSYTLVIFIILLQKISFTQSIECFDCSEKGHSAQHRCSKNATRSTSAENTDQKKYMCRIWLLGDTAVSKSLMPEDKCTNETLQDIVDRNFNNNFDFLFEGTSVPEAKAYCCNQSFCNFNATFAILNESPSSNEHLQQDIGIAVTAVSRARL